ncbi:hypothetical protein GYMLUDRAFT_178209, partial [Collybiopsis luxurians FD-317 M1]
WPGYDPWSRAILSKDLRSPPGPITKAKLAKNIAKCVQRFLQEKHKKSAENVESRWPASGSDPGSTHIKLEDLILVSLHNVSKGSWQPQLRLARPLSSSRKNQSSEPHPEFSAEGRGMSGLETEYKDPFNHSPIAFYEPDSPVFAGSSKRFHA